MTTPPAQPGDSQQADLSPRDAAHWAKHVTTLRLGDVPAEAINLNVTGKRVVGPLQGFGKLWQKTYRVELTGIQTTPVEVIATWKQSFSSPGDVALLNLSVGGGVKLSTGILVLYADEESFTFMTPQGHIFAGWITFSAAPSERDGVTAAQVQVLLRANDPLYELGMPIVVQRREDRFWQQTVTNLARHLGVADPAVTTSVVCVDRKRQWSNARNVWHNAGVRTALYTLGAPLRAFRRSPRGEQDEQPRERE